MATPPASDPQRRTLLAVLAGILAALLAAAIYPVWRFLSPQQRVGETTRVTLERDAAPVGGAYFFNFRGRPAVLLQSEPGVFRAFSAVCTHLGCIVQWLPERGEFLCPCHAGTFAADGRVLGGPPPRPLESLPLSLEGERVVIG